MKQIQWREGGRGLAGLLIGFNFGMATYMAFFLPPHTHRNPLAVFIASGCFSVGMILAGLTRSKTLQGDKTDEKRAA